MRERSELYAYYNERALSLTNDEDVQKRTLEVRKVCRQD